MKAATGKTSRHLQILIHSLGLSCLGGAVFLQILVFTDIIRHGYFMAVENNPTILAFEIALTIFALTYFLYMYQKFLRSIRQQR